MKKYAFVFVFFFSCVQGQVSIRPIHEPTKISFRYETDELILTLENQSCFLIKIMPTKRPQTWSEWWSNQTPMEWSLDESFFCDPTKWNMNANVQVSEASSTPYPGYEWVLVNLSNNQKVFAKAIPHSDRLLPKIQYIDYFLNQRPLKTTQLLTTEPLFDGVIILRDHSIFELQKLNYNSRSFWQWYNDEPIDQPDPCFIFNYTEWSPFDEIRIYSLDDSADQNLGQNKWNKNLSYLIENLTRQQYAFASKVYMNDLIASYRKKIDQSYQDGFTTGYYKGYSKGIEDQKKTAQREKENRLNNQNHENDEYESEDPINYTR